MNNNNTNSNVDILGIGCICILLFVPFLNGNIAIIFSVFEGDFSILTSSGFYLLSTIVAVIADLLITVLAIKHFIKKTSNIRLEERKKQAAEEIKKNIEYKQEIVDNLNYYFKNKISIVSFLRLVDLCSHGSETLELYQQNESEIFNSKRMEMIAKLEKSEAKRFPESIIQLNDYIKILSNEIEDLKIRLEELPKAGKYKTNEIILLYCEKIKKEKSQKKHRMIISSVVTAIISVVLLFSVLSSWFAMFIAETYHKEVLNEQLQTNGFYDFWVIDIKYETQNENEDYYHNYGDVKKYYTTEIVLSSDKLFTIEDAKNLNDLYSIFDVYIESWWAIHEEYFENSEDLKIMVVDDGVEYLIDEYTEKTDNN